MVFPIRLSCLWYVRGPGLADFPLDVSEPRPRWPIGNADQMIAGCEGDSALRKRQRDKFHPRAKAAATDLLKVHYFEAERQVLSKPWLRII